MKKKILLFLALILFINSKEFVEKEKLIEIKSFYGILNDQEEIKMLFVEYKDQLGFKIGRIYFLTEKKVFRQTFENTKINYRWWVYVDCNGELLRVQKFVWALAVDNKNGYLDLIINTDSGHESYFNNISVMFHENEIEMKLR